WAYMLSGTARITAVDQYGGSFVDDVNAGDLWFFASGIPHSNQAHSDGCEFLLVFDDGIFSENGTLLLTDLLIYTSPKVIVKNFGQPETSYADMPKEYLYIFCAPTLPPLHEALVPVLDTNDDAPQFSFRMSDIA